MPALFDTGFFVREPAWHGLGIVLPDYPGRDEAMTLAGHDFDVVEVEIGRFDQAWNVPVAGWKAHVRSDNGTCLAIHPATFTAIQNSVAYDIAEILFDQGFLYETGITLDGGKTCAITLKLDEPIVISGDDTITLPFGCLSWSHDGSGSLRVRSGSIRQVCANTVSASEAEGKRLGTDFTFRHTKNVHERIEDAKKAVHGVRENLNHYAKVMDELCAIDFTPDQRDLFVSTIIGDVTLDRNGVPESLPVSMGAAASDRVKSNIASERAKIDALFMGDTVPEAHALTGYGAFQAAVEYFDHLRNYKSQESYVKRTLLTNNPAKAQLASTIRKIDKSPIFA